QIGLEFSHETKAFRTHVRQSILLHKNGLMTTSRKLHAQTDLTIERNRERIQFYRKDLAQKTGRSLTGQRTLLDDAKQSLLQYSTRFIDFNAKNLEQLQR